MPPPLVNLDNPPPYVIWRFLRFDVHGYVLIIVLASTLDSRQRIHAIAKLAYPCILILLCMGTLIFVGLRVLLPGGLIFSSWVTQNTIFKDSLTVLITISYSYVISYRVCVCALHFNPYVKKVLWGHNSKNPSTDLLQVL